MFPSKSNIPCRFRKYSDAVVIGHDEKPKCQVGVSGWIKSQLDFL